MRPVALLALALGGCSFLLVDSPPSDWRQRPTFSCTDSYLWPVVDGALTASTLVTAVASTGQDGEAERAGGISGGLVTAAIFGASAIWGVMTVGSCRAAIEEQGQRGPIFAPGPASPLPPPPPPSTYSPSTPPSPPPPGPLPPGWRR